MASSKTPFTYQRLESEDINSFRLLSLLPGDDDSPLECTLMHTQRGSYCRTYEALSYAWGNPTLSSKITLNGRQLPITHNLGQALRSLRNSRGGLPRMLWVDAICIDQAHVSERNHQVTQIGEIYAGAERVVIWLGEASRDSDMALTFMLKLYEHLATKGEISITTVQSSQYSGTDFALTLRELLLNQKCSDELEAGARILARPWWRRAWVVQELVVAKDAICYCGKMSVPCYLLSSPVPETSTRLLGYVTFGINFEVAQFIFRKLLERLYRQHCTDPRDKVYSVLGMTHPKLREILKPDYAKSVSQVFTEAIAADIIDGADLNALLLVDHGDKLTNQDLPSWVADLRNILGYELMNISEPEVPASIDFSPDLRVLRIRGFVVDSIVGTRLQDTDVAFQLLLHPHQNKRTWDIEQIAARLVDEGGVYVSKAYNTPHDPYRNVERVVYDVMSCGMIKSFPNWVQHTVTYPDEEEHRIPASADKLVPRTLQLQHSRFRKLITLWWNRMHNRSKNAFLKPMRWRDILSTAVDVTAGRTSVLSSKRHLGLAPTATQPGDCIFVLSGLAELAILRPQTGGTYKFIGASYVHEFMNKEWREHLDRGVFRKQIVNIS